MFVGLKALKYALQYFLILLIVTYEASIETKLRCKGDILYHLLETKLLL